MLSKRFILFLVLIFVVIYGIFFVSPSRFSTIFAAVFLFTFLIYLLFGFLKISNKTSLGRFLHYYVPLFVGGYLYLSWQKLLLSELLIPIILLLVLVEISFIVGKI
jgi:hypothetical protein